MKIGKISIQNPILLAPMEDVTDIGFRLICKELGADIVYTEFVNAEGLIRNSDKTKLKMFFLEEERPIGIQLYGGLETSLMEAAKMAEELGPDLIDINCGCWVRKVVGHGAGSGLLRDLKKLESVITNVVKSVKLPVTIKTRLGWDKNTIIIKDVAKIAEASGAKGITIHCRTRAQGHKGEPDYSYIPEVKNLVSIPVIVNGGIYDYEKAKTVFETTSCDGIMIAQGALNNPWIFKEIKQYLAEGKVPQFPTIKERFTLLLKHLRYAILYKGERKAVIEIRKHYHGYFKGLPNISKFRMELMKCESYNQIVENINKFYPHQLDEIKGFNDNLTFLKSSAGIEHILKN